MSKGSIMHISDIPAPMYALILIREKKTTKPSI